MQTALITDRHRKWLNDKLGTTFEEVEALSREDADVFYPRLCEAEADAFDTEDEALAGEVVDIICGPYEDGTDEEEEPGE